MRRRSFLASVGVSAGVAGVAGSIDDVAAATGDGVIDPALFDSTASLLNASQEPLTDDSLVAVWAAPSAFNDDDDSENNAVQYPDGTDIPLVAVDGNVAGIGTPLVDDGTDFSYGQEEFLLNLWDELIGGGTVLWDEGHEQFYDLASASTFEAYAEGQGQFSSYAGNDYTVEATTDIEADLGGADALVITSPSAGYTDAELTALGNFVAGGGTVILHDQSDFSNFDETANLNAIASSLGVGFRFNDDQVFDEESNAGSDFVPVTANFNDSQFPALFENRPGIDEAISLDPTETYTVDVTDVADGDTVTVDFVDRIQTEEIRVLGVDTPEVAAASGAELAEEWEGLADRVGLTELQFGSTSSLLDASMEPYSGQGVAVYAEPSATNTDADGNGDAVSYPDDAPIPLAAIDGGVAGFGSPFVDDDTLFFNAELDNDEFLLNVWDALIGGGSTVRWDESHGQFYDLASASTFESYAEENGYTVEAGSSIPSDTSAVDGLVITSPSDPFSDQELADLASFVDDGGAVILHDQSDFENNDATANTNAIADALDLAFRFNDDQVVDEQNNTGQPFRPTTTQFVVEKDLFREREGVDEELVVPAEGEPVEAFAFGEGTAALVDPSDAPLTDDSIIVAASESTATNTDADGNGEATSYPDNPIPVVALDGQVAGFGAPFVVNGTLENQGDFDNEEFLLNLWDDLLGGSGTVRWDESHGQFYDLASVSTFESYAEENGYTVEAGTSIPADTSAVDALAVTTPSEAFTSQELADLSSFVADGGAVFLFSQSDFNNFDETANINAIADELGAGFNFDDSQVLDSENNAGAEFRPTTENLNTTDFSLFSARPGVDDQAASFWGNEFPYLSYWAEQASSWAVDQLAGERVEISFDPAGSTFNDGVRDPFGRVLAYIDYDASGDGTRDANYSQRLIEEGYARSYGSSLSELERLLGAELTAREEGAGVWRQSNPDRSPTIRNDPVEEVYVPKAERVTTEGMTTLGEDRTAVFSAATATPADAPLVALDRDANVAAVGGLVVDEGYEQAEGFPVDTSGFGNFPLVGNLIDTLTDREGPVLVAAGEGQFNAGEGLSSEDVAFFQRYLEGLDVGLEGINDLTADRLGGARAVLYSPGLEAPTEAELSALADFAAAGGAVLILSSAAADDTQRTTLNDVAAGLGTDLRFTGQAVTDGTSNLDGDATLPVTGNLSDAVSLAPLYGPFQPDVEAAGLTVEFPDGQLGREGTITGDVVLSEAPDGLAGFDLTVELADTSVAELTGASYPEELAPTDEPVLADDGSAVTVAAADTGETIESGATDVTLASVEVTAQSPGTTDATLTVDQIDEDDGDRLPTVSEEGTLTVAPQRSVVDGLVPTDPDGDGVFEDVDGDGELSYNDVVVLFQNRDDPAVTERVSAFDFNDNGRIDFDDITELFDEVGL